MYSRKRFSASVVENVINFEATEYQTHIADILREREKASRFDEILKINDSTTFNTVISQTSSTITIDNGMIGYSIHPSTFDLFSNYAKSQWEATSQFPQNWEFDDFSLKNFKTIWISLTALSYIHLFCILNIENPEVRLNNQIIQYHRDDLIKILASYTNLSMQRISKMLDYITYDQRINNTDIIYQPLVQAGGLILLAPALFITSQPERNLFCLVCLNKDREHSREVNQLEGLMIKQIKDSIKNSKIYIFKRSLPKPLPDIDIGLFDPASNSALLCELKWFIPADSVREVLARESDVSHGCSQCEKIMGYILQNKQTFTNDTLGKQYSDEIIDYQSVVVTKNNVRTANGNIPVIDLDDFIDYLSKKPIAGIIQDLRFGKHVRTSTNSNTSQKAVKSVQYGNYIFNIPALEL